MDLRLAGLEPAALEGEAGPLHRLHPQEADIKFAAPLQVLDDERDVIERADLEGRFVGAMARASL